MLRSAKVIKVLRPFILFTQTGHGGRLLHHSWELSMGVITTTQPLVRLHIVSIRRLLGRHTPELTVLLIRKAIVILLSWVHIYLEFKIQI